MGYGNFRTGTTLIYPKAQFYLKRIGSNGNYACWYSYGTITLGEDSVLNNPKQVILYNSIANVIYSKSTSKFDFNIGNKFISCTIFFLFSITYCNNFCAPIGFIAYKYPYKVR